MGFNLRPYGKVFENLMYNDTCSIYREKSTTNIYGATKPNGREEIYKDKPCKFSFKNIDNPDDANDVNIPVTKLVTVFISLDYDIKAGDQIIGNRIDPVSQISQNIRGICGEPNRFDTHQEIPIEIAKEN